MIKSYIVTVREMPSVWQTQISTFSLLLARFYAGLMDDEELKTCGAEGIPIQIHVRGILRDGSAFGWLRLLSEGSAMNVDVDQLKASAFDGKKLSDIFAGGTSPTVICAGAPVDETDDQSDLSSQLQSSSR